MSDEIIINIQSLTLSYKLYPSPIHMALDIFHLKWLFPFKKFNFPLKNAIENMNLQIKKGERIGLVGRNGAGKTSLLKILTGILTPTSGCASVSGKVQSLLTSGLGFDPNLTGLQNIQSSLVYNGLSGKEFEDAILDVIDFCELGEYIHQPLKTYSLGMQSRLAFATSTAIKPDILIIDEVLGAGDAYFINKCAARVKNLTSSKNTTLILVSHSTSQILKFCDKCIWIDEGKIIESGPSMDVVKKYDKYIHELQNKKVSKHNATKNNQLVSRWEGENKDILITGLKIQDAKNKDTSLFTSGEAASLTIQTKVMKSVQSVFPVIMGYNDSGVTAFFCYSKVEISENNTTPMFTLNIENLNLGPGDYYISVALYKSLDLNDLHNSVFYDLIDRSFQFQVIDPIVKNNPAIVKVNYSWSQL